MQNPKYLLMALAETAFMQNMLIGPQTLKPGQLYLRLTLEEQREILKTLCSSDVGNVRPYQLNDGPLTWSQLLDQYRKI